MKLTKMLAAAAFSAALVFAQGPGPGGRGPRDGDNGTPPDPQTMIQRRVDFLASQLNLTDDQKTKAVSIFTNAHSGGENARSSLQTTHQSLSEAVKKNDTAAIDQLSTTIGSLMGQLTAIERKADAAFYALLTADQKAKFDSLRGGFGFGGRMGPGEMGRFRGR